VGNSMSARLRAALALPPVVGGMLDAGEQAREQRCSGSPPEVRLPLGG
jgi:hypothetical protein